MSKLTHIDGDGGAHMVDVGGKEDSLREAQASGHIAMQAETLQAIKDNMLKKGDVLSTARIAGIMAAKKTSELIPLCHPLNINKISVEFDYDDSGILVTSLVRLSGKTGVEMEALTAASIALLTIYDMAKALQKDMVIGEIKLLKKSGGKSGDWIA